MRRMKRGLRKGSRRRRFRDSGRKGRLVRHETFAKVLFKAKEGWPIVGWSVIYEFISKKK